MRITEYMANRHAEAVRLANAKTALATAIEGKGVTVPEGTKLDGMAALVEAISAGLETPYEIESGTITFAASHKPHDTPLVINHNLGVTPQLFIAINSQPGFYPKYHIAYVLKASGNNICRISKYGILIYSTKAGSDTPGTSYSSDCVALSDTDITISSTDANLDFCPTLTSKMRWFAFANVSNL